MDVNRGPLARSEDLIIEELGDEVLVYDSRADKAHCLSPDAARVWSRCDGSTPTDGLVAQLGLEADRVEGALDELERCELLDERPAAVGHTRRELTLKVAKVGAAAATMPLIVSVAAPTPAMAATLAFCQQFSSGNCGGSTGCSSEVGCCCCTPPVGTGGRTPGGACASIAGQCKNCVPTDQQNTLCPQFGHGAGSSCSATGDDPV